MKAIWLCLLLVSIRSEGASQERTLWIFEQFSEIPTSTEHDKGRQQLGLSATNYSDNLSSQVFGNLDLGLFELAGLYSKRTFFDLDGRGEGSKNSQLNIEQSFLLEVGRYFSTVKQHYGRLAVGYFRFPGCDLNGLRLSLSTGILPSDFLPWELRLKLAYFYPFRDPQKYLSIEGGAARAWGKTRIGGFMSWSERPREEAGIGVYESMLFTAGPYLNYALGPSHLEVAAHWRLWLDKENFTRNGVTASGSPNEIAPLPDFSLQWAFIF